MSGGQQRYRDATTVHYLIARHHPDGGTSPVVTRVYRGVLARSLSSSCEMVPSDSVWFDAQAKRCGVLATSIRAIQRLFLERSASFRVLDPVHHRGRLRWLDPSPSPCLGDRDR